MAAVLDGPVAAVEGEHGGRVSGVGRAAGDAVDDLQGAPAGLFVDDFALDDERLADAGEVEVAVEGGGGPDGPALQAAMGEGGLFPEVGFTAFGESHLDVGPQGRLIVFDGEEVVGVAVDEVARELALGQQGIGGEGFAGDVEGVDQRDEGADLVGLLDLVVAGYRQGADFF